MSQRRLSVLSKGFSLFAGLMIMCSLMVAAGLPASAASSKPNLKPCQVKMSKKKGHQNLPKTVSHAQSVNFATTKQNDNNLGQGQTQTLQAGQKGSRTLTYKAAYNKKHKLTGCKLASNKVTKAPVSRIVAVGTYVAPAPAPAPAPPPAPSSASSCPNGTYVNSAGNTVCSPYNSPGAPAGATAQCVDGTYSFSQSRSGTCSHHGGVASWL